MKVPLALQKQPYHLLFIGGILIFLFSFLVSEQMIDIHVHDTYYIIPRKLILLILSAILFLFWLVYKFMSRFFYSVILINIHAFLTTTALLILILFFNLQKDSPAKTSHQLYDLGNATKTFTNFNSYVLITTLILFLIQFIFLFNLIAGILKKAFKDKDVNTGSRRRKHRRPH